MKTKMQRKKEYQFILIFIILGIFGIGENSKAATYYAAPKGSLAADDALSGSGTLNDPWSIKSAMANAQAGDTVYFRGGTYQAGQSEYLGRTSFYTPSHSGTSDDARITFIAYPGETPIINGNTAVPKASGTLTDAHLSSLPNNSDKTAYMTDIAKDFNALGVKAYDVVRTATKENAAGVDSISADGHTIYFQTYGYYNLTNLNAGDSYTIVNDSTKVFGSGGSSTRRNYITFDGFTIQANDGMELGGIAFYGLDPPNMSTGNIVQNCTFVGPYLNRGNEGLVTGDNRQFVFIEHQDGFILRNSVLKNLRNAQENGNTSGTKTYHNTNLTIENNEFYNITKALFLKSRTDIAKIRNNYLHDNHVSVDFSSNVYPHNDGEFSNNIITNSFGGVRFYSDSDCAGSSRWNIHNNTFYNETAQPQSSYLFQMAFPTASSASGYRIYDNVFQSPLTTPYNGSTIILLRWTGDSYGLDYIDYNAYGSPMHINTCGTNNAEKTLSALQARTCSANTLIGGAHDLNSLGDSPIKFSSSNPQNIQDFALASDSPGYRAGSDGKDMGADVSLVGPNASGGGYDTTAPDSPNGLSVN